MSEGSSETGAEQVGRAPEYTRRVRNGVLMGDLGGALPRGSTGSRAAGAKPTLADGCGQGDGVVVGGRFLMELARAEVE